MNDHSAAGLPIFEVEIINDVPVSWGNGNLFEASIKKQMHRSGAFVQYAKMICGLY